MSEDEFVDEEIARLGALKTELATLRAQNALQEEAINRLLARQGWKESKLTSGKTMTDDDIVTVLCSMGDIRFTRNALAQVQS